MSRAQAFKATSTDHDVTRARAAAPVSDADRSAAPPAAVPHQLAHVPVTSAPVQLKENGNGLPDHLKSGIEHLSGHSMDDVQVHYNSSQPAQLQAHAYAQGTNIHVAPGQEQHLPHEAWHVVQQKQGRVQPTMQMKGVAVNDSSALEREADQMGARAMRAAPVQLNPKKGKGATKGQHHNPEGKKYLAKGVGAQQNAVSAEQQRIHASLPAGTHMSLKESKRQAKANLKK
jgi:hypothetical protein